MKKFFHAFILLPIILVIGCHTVSNKADLVILSGTVYTVVENEPTQQAIAIQDDKILRVGSNNEIKSFIGSGTQVLELDGQMVMPGLIDAHAHYMSLGYSKMNLNLKKPKNWHELVEMVKQAAANSKPGEWILGRGWHQEKWIDPLPEFTEGNPSHDDISAVSKNNPVYLTHASGHAVLVNKMAMDLAGIDRTTKNPHGGHIIRDLKGEATGVFLETAEDLIYRKLKSDQDKLSPPEKTLREEKAFLLAAQACLKYGITSIHDAGSSFERIRFFQKMIDAKKSPVRLWVMIGEDNDQLKKHLSAYKILNYGNHHLTVRSIKRYMDGALGAHGAWLLEPYNDLPTTRGLNAMPLDEFSETANLALEHGFQLCTHAIGDRGNRETLNIYQKTTLDYPDKKKLRWRIEHAQHLHPDDIPRFKQLGVIAAMQSVHCTSDGPWVLKRLGEERSRTGAYVWKYLLDSGAIICNGTDTPVEDINPFINFHAAVTRKMPDGTRFFPEQIMTRKQALRSYTINAAYAAFEEDIKGSLKAGKLADITILSKDIMMVPEDQIQNTKVLYTIIGGKIVYKKSQGD